MSITHPFLCFLENVACVNKLCLWCVVSVFSTTIKNFVRKSSGTTELHFTFHHFSLKLNLLSKGLFYREVGL